MKKLIVAVRNFAKAPEKNRLFPPLLRGFPCHYTNRAPCSYTPIVHWKISPPPGFNPWTVTSVASRCTDWAITDHGLLKASLNKYLITQKWQWQGRACKPTVMEEDNQCTIRLQRVSISVVSSKHCRSEHSRQPIAFSEYEENWGTEHSRAVFLNRRPAGRYRALTSIITGHKVVFLEFVILVF